jgi:hypothetical protein
MARIALGATDHFGRSITPTLAAAVEQGHATAAKVAVMSASPVVDTKRDAVTVKQRSGGHFDPLRFSVFN